MYKITETLTVINSSGAIVGGPYKNEESAKRRIRELKRRDAAKISEITERDRQNEMAADAAGDDQPDVIMPPDVAPTVPRIAVGVYPAIGKNEYRRRWNA